MLQRHVHTIVMPIQSSRNSSATLTSECCIAVRSGYLINLAM
jgi:hypothetical protein